MTNGSTTAPPIRVGLISLGCAKNLVDAEIMLGALLQQGVQVTNDPAEADVVIINTCSFIDAAQEESVHAILHSAEFREANRPPQALVVAGCLPQRFRAELPKLLPEVDAFMGIDQVPRVTDIVKQALAHRRRRSLAAPPETDAARWVEVHRRPTYIPDFATPRFRLTPRHFAYLKIAEGCNHPCSFCLIPRMRGSHRSRPPSDVVREARALLADGVKELDLISQDTTCYGLDLRPDGAGPGQTRSVAGVAARLRTGATTLSTLVRELNAVPGDFWIRLLYTHPAHWTDELIRTIAACPKVVRYVDLPLQHIHDVMLERMRRETTRRQIEELIARLRAGIAGITLRTTFIVGFPGETDACFDALLEFIRATKFERLGVFTYSREAGTRAGRMDNQVSDAIKRHRRDRAMAEQHRVAREVAAACVGRTIKVLVERPAKARELSEARVCSSEHGLLREGDPPARQLRGRFLVARGEADAPDIDGRVYVRGALPPGEFAQVRITGHTDYDLVAEPASEVNGLPVFQGSRFQACK